MGIWNYIYIYSAKASRTVRQLSSVRARHESAFAGPPSGLTSVHARDSFSCGNLTGPWHFVHGRNRSFWLFSCHCGHCGVSLCG